MLGKTSVKNGVYLGLALVAGTQILTWLGLGLSSWFVFLTYGLVVVFVFLNARKIKMLNGGKFSFANALLALLFLILISRIIFQTYMFVYTRYVDPDWVNMAAETWTNQLQEADVRPEIIEQTISDFRQSLVPSRMFTIELVKFGIPQFILGLIVSVFFIFNFKRKKQV